MKEKTGQRVREIREANSMTMEVLGSQINKSKQWVSELERGNIRLSYDMAVKIAAVFNATPDIFLPDKSKKISQNTDQQRATRQAG